MRKGLWVNMNSSKAVNPYLSMIKSIGLSVLLLAVVTVLPACGSSKTEGEGSQVSSVAESAKASDGEGNAAAVSDSSAEDQAQVYPLTVTDELGHEVTIPSKPVRIFAPMMEDSLLVLGVKPVVQWSNGVEPQLYLQDQLGDVPQISFAGGMPSPEAIMALEPDLIILNNQAYAEKGGYEQLSKIAPTYVFENAATDLSSSIQILGELLDKSGEAEEALKEYNDKVASTREKLSTLVEGKKAAIIRFNAKGMFFMNNQYYSGYVMNHELGFEQSTLVKDGAFQVSLEILPELDADYIVLANDGNQGDAYLKELKKSSLWQTVPAVKAGHVYETNSDYWLSGGLIAQGKVIDDVVGFLAP